MTGHHPTTSQTRMIHHPRHRMLRLLGYAGAMGVLLLVFSLHLEPDFMVTLAQQVWACF